MKKRTYTKTIISCLLLTQGTYLLCTDTNVAPDTKQETKEQNIIKRVGPFNKALIDFVDGKRYGIHGQIIGTILRVRSVILKVLDGELQTDKTHIGLYTYQNKRYGVRELKEIEKQMVFKRTVPSKEFNQCLKIAKNDFVEKMHKFLEPAHAMKSHMLPLIEDFCVYRNISADSLLLKWGEASDKEAEKKMFDNDMTNFALFEDFCLDLNAFLKELVNSCPKAKAQFKQIIADIKNKKS